MKNKKTIVVNLFGGPGTGKSTGATYIFSKLKMAGVDAEYISEYAKDKVWENNSAVFECQFYVAGKQAFRFSRCNGKVDVIVTDSPIILNTLYCQENNPFLKDAILYEFNKLNNYNVFLQRVKKYNPNGRHQTEEQAKDLDNSTKKMLEDNGLKYETFTGDMAGYDKIVEVILAKLKENQ